MNLRALIVLILFAVGCGGESTLPAGTEGAPCYPNGTCNLGLVCVATTCTTATADAGTDAGGDAGSGIDGSVVDGSTTTDAGTDSAVADAGADQDAGADSGTSADAGSDSGTLVDAGTTADAGVDSGTPTSCLDTDTDTGTYTFLISNLSTQFANFNLDGVDNTDTVAGCGITDTTEGYDNGMGTMVAAEFVGGSPHGVQTIPIDLTLSNALFGNNLNNSDLTFQVVLTHVKQNIQYDMSDLCVGVHLLISRPNQVQPTPLASGAMVDGRIQGAFDRAITLPFNIGGGTVLTVKLLQPVFDFKFLSCAGYNQPCMNKSLSFIGGSVFMAPTAADTAAGRDYSGLLSLDDQLYGIWSGFYTTYTRPYLFQYQDLFLNPDGTRAPCGANQPPNAYATTLRFAR